MGKRRHKSEENTQTPRKPSRPVTLAVLRSVNEWAEEAATSQGLVLFDVEVNSGWLVRVFVDRPGAVEPGKGIVVDECVAVSRYLETLMDADDRVPEDYRLEVSSPGVTREITAERQYALVVGRRLKVVTRENVQAQNVHEGTLLGVEERTLKIAVGESVLEIALDNVAKAKLVFEF